MKKECYIHECNEKTIAKVRQYCNFHKLQYRTLNSRYVITYSKIKKWDDVKVQQGFESVDYVGNQIYIVKHK